jgi:hypothetical protein
MTELKQMTATVDPAAKQMARFVVMYDTAPTPTRSNVTRRHVDHAQTYCRTKLAA